MSLFFSTALLSVLLHVALGWEWTVVAGLGAGLWASRSSSGLFIGAGATALGWAAVVVYSAAVAPAALRLLVDMLGSLAGNIPGAALVGSTVFLGGLLGALGGSIGALVRPIVWTDAAAPAD